MLTFEKISGMDLAYEISKLAVRVTLSHHHKTPPLTAFPKNVNLKPDVKQLTENGVEFTDGSQEDYSVIFYCTGTYEWIMQETQNHFIFWLKGTNTLSHF